MHLIDKFGEMFSSIMYRAFIEGRAMKINMADGRIVQIVSISCPSDMNLLNLFLTIDDAIMYRVRMVIVTRMIIEWSWKNSNCSIVVEFLSWNDNAVHVGILFVV
jgi:hypothetical protein